MNRNRIVIFSGVSLGLLIGICIGLSVSQVVGIVLAALTSLLAAYFGLKPANEQAEQSQERLLIMGCFSLTCFLSIIASVYLRNNNVLSPSRQQFLREMTELGFTAEQARTVLLYDEYGIVPPQATIADKHEFRSKATVLFNTEAQLKIYEELKRENFASVEEQLNGFRARKGAYEAFANTLSQYVKDPQQQEAILQAMFHILPSK